MSIRIVIARQSGRTKNKHNHSRELARRDDYAYFYRTVGPYDNSYRTLPSELEPSMRIKRKTAGALENVRFKAAKKSE